MLPAHVEVVVLKALEKRADMRYPTMEEFMRAMSDPVGYVEAHGGVTGFLTRHLVPSNAPLPPVRLTPAPLTPLPGALIAPNLSSVVGGASPSIPGVPNAAAPMTLSSGASQLHASRSRLGYIVTGAVIVAAAVAAIIVLVGKDRNLVVVSGGSGSETASGEIRSATGTAAGTAPGSAPGAAPGTSIGTAAGTQVAAQVAPAGSAAVPAGIATPPAGSGGPGPAVEAGDSGSAAQPTGDHVQTMPEAMTVEILVGSTPAGARIYVNNVDTGKTTPDKLDVPRKGGPISITLRLKSYEPFTFRGVDVSESSKQIAELVKIRSTPPVTKCKTPERSGCARDAKGCCVSESTSAGHNGSGTKNGSASQDPDGLLHP
jgi:hypothetical protein